MTYKYVKEAFLVKHGAEVLASGVGDAASVDFPFEELWPRLKLFPPTELLFLHVHPPGYDVFSRMDFRCHAALKRALGGDFPFGLMTFSEDGTAVKFISICRFDLILPCNVERLKQLSSSEE